MANNKPVVTSTDQTVVSNESLSGPGFVKATDADGDDIVRYRIFHQAADPSPKLSGYFELDGVQMDRNAAFFVKASELQNLVFVSATRGQRLNSPDYAFIRAYDGIDWGTSKRIAIRTLHNKVRPVVIPHHQSIVATQKVDGMDLFTVTDGDGSTIKFYEFRDLNDNNGSAYMMFQGQNMQGTGWFTVTPDQMVDLQVVGGSIRSQDRFQIRANDGRFYSKGKVSIVRTLERPLVDTSTTVIFDELERKPLRDFVADAGSVPPITEYEFMDLNGSPISGKVRRNAQVFAANQVHKVSASVFSVLSFEGGLYDNRARDGFLVRGSNGQFNTPWERIELMTEPAHQDALDTGEDWTQFLLAPFIPGDPLDITYSFLQAVPAYYDGGAPERTGFARLNNRIRENVRHVLSQLSDALNVRFVEVADTVGGTMRFGSFNQGQTNPGRAYIPMDETLDLRGGDVWFNNFVDFPTVNWPGVYSNQEPGTVGLAFMRRLIGEAMGLRVPTTGFPLLPSTTDHHRFTAMAHDFFFQVPKPDGDNFRYAESYQLYDIDTLRRAYGANPATRIEDNVYTYDNDRHTVMTIVDMGGTDAIDVGNQVREATIDLRQGAFSWIGEEIGFFGPEPGIDNVGIAYGTEIENAFGTIFDDSLTGNELDNILSGRKGKDFLNGLGGNDMLIGGEDDDLYRFDLYGGHDVIADSDADSIDTLEIHSHSDDLNSFTDHLSFRRSGNDLIINLTLNQNNGFDLIDGTIRIRQMLGTSGVETLRLINHQGNNIEGVDIDLTSAFSVATDTNSHLKITGNFGSYGALVTQA